MIKRSTYLFALPALVLLGSCATTQQTAQQTHQTDDVYYSTTQAKEAPEPVAVVQTEPQATQDERDYRTDEQLYGDAYGNSYAGDYAERIYRFRDYTPWRNYYSSIYNFYDPFYSYYDPFYSPFSSYGFGPSIGIGIGIGGGFYNYNPWRYYGYNYGSNFWGPYSYNSYYPGYYGRGYYGGGYYGGGYGLGGAVYTSPNYRPRPARGINNSVTGSGDRRATGVIRNGNGNGVVESGRRTRPAATQGTSNRPRQVAPRPERVNRAPQRQSPPPRVNTRPSDGGGNNYGGGRSSGGSSSGGARPSRN